MTDFQRPVDALSNSKAALREQAYHLRSLAGEHGYCFTVSDDYTCDRGWGDCRSYRELVREGEGHVEDAIRAVKEAELTITRLAMPRPTPTVETTREGGGWWVRTWMVLAFLGLIFISGMAVGAVFMITQQGR